MRRSIPLAVSVLSLGASSLVGPAEAIAAGTYSGAKFSSGWGYLSVTVQLHGKKIAAVTTNVTQDYFPHSIQVNAFAIPVLKREALKSSSYEIHSVSGATQTSQAFVQSLKSALRKAKI